MKTIPHRKFGAKKGWHKIVAVVIIIGTPLSAFFYGYSCIDSFVAFTHSFRSYQIDYASLIPANYSRLDQMAREYEKFLLVNHLPLNYTLSAYWNANFTSIVMYTSSGDASIWSGMSLAAACFEYAAAKREGNATLQTSALLLVKRLISGVSLLLAVPNGGIGPNFSGVLARSVCPKNWNSSHPAIAGFSKPADNVNIFNGAGNYSDWNWIGYNSLDQYSGIIMGVSCAAKLVDDAWVQSQVRLLATQMLEFFKKMNWYLIDGNGRTTGQAFQYKIEHPGFWLLATIFMGVLVDPIQYSPLYYQWAIDRGYADPKVLANDLSLFNLINYYSLNINWVIFYALATFETNPTLHATYQQLMKTDMYPVMANHRNAWLNMMYLHVMQLNDSSIKKDVEDALMRFDIERIPGQKNSTKLPERGLNVTNYYWNLVPASKPRHTFAQWLATRLHYPAANINFAASMVGDEAYFDVPKTVDQFANDDFAWQENPWTDSQYSPAHLENSGLSFLLPYWMGRWAGMIPEAN